MGKYKIEVLPTAWDDLQGIFDYIFLDSPKSAENILDKIMKSLRHLEDFPNAGAYVPDTVLKRNEFRMVVCPPYISFYRFEGDTVYIYHVVHNSRRYKSLLKTYLT